MTTTTVQFSWLSVIQKADPEHARNKRYVVEYEFSAPGGGYGLVNGFQTHENGMRVFRGNYDERGPYAPETVGDGGLTWGGVQIIWGGDELTWGED